MSDTKNISISVNEMDVLLNGQRIDLHISSGDMFSQSKLNKLLYKGYKRLSSTMVKTYTNGDTLTLDSIKTKAHELRQKYCFRLFENSVEDNRGAVYFCPESLTEKLRKDLRELKKEYKKTLEFIGKIRDTLNEEIFSFYSEHCIYCGRPVKEEKAGKIIKLRCTGDDSHIFTKKLMDHWLEQNKSVIEVPSLEEIKARKRFYYRFSKYFFPTEELTDNLVDTQLKQQKQKMYQAELSTCKSAIKKQLWQKMKLILEYIDDRLSKREKLRADQLDKIKNDLDALEELNKSTFKIPQISNSIDNLNAQIADKEAALKVLTNISKNIEKKIKEAEENENIAMDLIDKLEDIDIEIGTETLELEQKEAVEIELGDQKEEIFSTN